MRRFSSLVFTEKVKLSRLIVPGFPGTFLLRRFSSLVLTEKVKFSFQSSQGDSTYYRRIDEWDIFKFPTSTIILFNHPSGLSLCDSTSVGFGNDTCLL